MSAEADELRRAFDRSFAEPIGEGRPATERLLGLRVGGERYALRVSEIAGVAAGRKIVPIPSALPQIVGLAASRGVVVAVYDLGALLGHAPRQGDTRYLVLAAGKEPVGLSCFELDGYLEVETSSLTAEAARPGGQHTRWLVRTADGPRAVVDLASVVEHIATAAKRSIREK